MKSIQDYKNFTLQVSLSKGVGPVLFKKLLQKNGSIKSTAKLIRKDKLANLINIDNELKILREKGIDSICLWEDNYPINLKNIADPPPIIFYRGNVELLKNQNCLSIVGSRRMSSYGRKYVHRIVEDFKELNFNIVSGLATGIDSIAHRCALKNGIPTIAVLASSVDEPTPRYNKYLYDEILENNGLIISEALPGSIMMPGFFPRRNRIIAGLSIGTLIIEAGEKSGALITANLAFRYDRPVFAVPGNLDSPYSVGSNTLIKDNKAKLVQTLNDILIDFSIDINPKAFTNLANLTDLEVLIYKYLENGPAFVEEIANFLKIEFSVIISSCSIMEMNAYISKNERGQYYLN